MPHQVKICPETSKQFLEGKNNQKFYLEECEETGGKYIYLNNENTYLEISPNTNFAYFHGNRYNKDEIEQKITNYINENNLKEREHYIKAAIAVAKQEIDNNEILAEEFLPSYLSSNTITMNILIFRADVNLDNLEIEEQKFLLEYFYDPKCEKTFTFDTFSVLYKSKVFSKITDKDIFDKIITNNNLGFSDFSKDLYKNNRDLIQTEDELRAYVDHQLRSKEKYILINEERKGDIDATRRIRDYSNMIEQINYLCVFDPMKVLKEFDGLNRVIAADIPYTISNNKESKKLNLTIDTFENRRALQLYNLCFLNEIPKSELIKVFNTNEDGWDLYHQYDSKSRNIEQNYIIKKSIFDRKPEIFDNEDFAKDLITNFISAQDNVDMKSWKRKGTDIQFIDFINEMNNKLSIDVLEILKELPEFNSLYEKNYMKNQLANF